MQPSFVIFSMIIVFAFLMLFVVMAGPLTALFKFIIRSFIGAGIIYLCNIVFSPFNIYIGVNVLTACIVGFLGIPGLGSLIIISRILDM